MGQSICASLSHTNYWYEVGMLKYRRRVYPRDTNRHRLCRILGATLATAFTVKNNCITVHRIRQIEGKSIVNLKPSNLLLNLRNVSSISSMPTMSLSLQISYITHAHQCSAEALHQTREGDFNDVFPEQDGAPFSAVGRTRLELSVKLEWNQHIRLLIANSFNVKLANTAKDAPMGSCFRGWRRLRTP